MELDIEATEDKQAVVDLGELEQLLPPDSYQLVLAHSRPAPRSKPATAILWNTVTGFAVLAVSAASVALFPFPWLALLVGVLTWLAGLVLTHMGPRAWQLLASMCVVTGSLISAAGIIWIEGGNDADEAPRSSLLPIASLFTCTAVAVKSSLMTVLATIALAVWFGSESFYCGTCFWLAVERPLVAVTAFTILAIVMHLLYRRLDRFPWLAEYANLALISSRTCLFMTQLGFLVGSLWGDEIDTRLVHTKVSDIFFAIVWALQLAAGMVWAARYERRWALYTLATFAAIHAIIQWFDRLGAEPWTVLLAGLLTLLFVAAFRNSTLRSTLYQHVRLASDKVLGPPVANPYMVAPSGA